MGGTRKDPCADFAAMHMVLAFFAGSQTEHAWSHTAYAW